MFMIMLKKHGPVLVFVLVLLLCGFWAYLSYEVPASDPDVLNAEKDKKTINEKLVKGDVTDAYVNSAKNQNELKFVETQKKSVERNKGAVDGTVGTFVAYPQPTRPKSPPPAVEVPGIKVFPKTPSLKDKGDDFSVLASRGVVYVKCEIPTPDEFKSSDGNKIALTEPVRIEIFRGLAKDKMDLTKPIGTIELGLEEEIKPAAAATTPGPAAPADTRSARQKAADEEKEKKTPAGTAAVKLLTTRVYKDTSNIAQKTEYFYQARLVMKYTRKELVEKTKNADGTDGPTYLYQLPDAKDAMPVKTATGARLFATALTGAKGDKTPTNFEFRLMQTTGNIPKPGERIRNPNAHDDKSYSVTLSMRVWIADVNDWVRKSLTDQREGDVIGGEISYKKPGETALTKYKFTDDLGYKLYEINTENVDSKVPGQTDTREVALLQNVKDPKDIVRVEKKPEPPAVDPKVKEYEGIIAAQTAEMEKIKKAAAAPVAPK